LLYFVNAFQASITANLTAYVLSGFESHSLIPVIYIVSNVMSAATYLPQAKILDLWGRAQGFFIMASLATIGLILMATTSNVQTFCAAQVFYSIGFVGMVFSIDVMTADSSKLRHRGLAFAFTSSPYIITALAGPKAAEGFYENISWRWAFGCFAIILPFVATPLFLLLLKNERKAKKNGLLVKTPSGRTLPQSIWYYFIEFDGMFSRAKKRALCD
jgi:MFS family permease